MLISHPQLDSTFCNPVTVVSPTSLSSHSQPPTPHCSLPEEQEWLKSQLPSSQEEFSTGRPVEDIFRTASPTVCCLPSLREQQENFERSSEVCQQISDQSTSEKETIFLRSFPKEVYHQISSSKQLSLDQVDIFQTASPITDLCNLNRAIFHQLDCFCVKENLKETKKNPSDKAKEIKPEVKLVMNVVEPEDDLNCLINNERKLELCGYYYGSLSWLNASHLLSKCKVGTFLIRDSEHSSYLYTLSVQTRRGPTSCRIEYLDGQFRLDSSKDLSHKMPRFDCVTNLVDFYVQLPKYLPQSNSNKPLTPVWLDMDEVNMLDVPVQIYKPLYRQVNSLQHICRLNIMQQIKGDHFPTKPRTLENPSVTLTRTMENNSRFKDLPIIIKDYLFQYPYSQ